MTFPLSGFALDPVDGTAIAGAQVRTYAILDSSHTVSISHTSETWTNSIGHWEFPAVDPDDSPTGQFAVRVRSGGKTFWVFPGISMQAQNLVGMDGIRAPLARLSVTNDLLVPDVVTNPKFADAAVTEDKLGFSLPGPATFRQAFLDAEVLIPTGGPGLALEITPGRVGTWLAIVSYDLRLLQECTFLGSIARDPIVDLGPGGAARALGPIQVVVTGSRFVPITSESQTIRALASVTAFESSSSLAAGATRLQAFWLSP